MGNTVIRAFVFVVLLGSSVAAWAADFTGFWMQDCADGYGLQIAPYQDGKYTVTFCGPGNPHCNVTPDPRLATPIVGDAKYEVLAANQLRVISEGYSAIYVRCTADIHPLLTFEHSEADKAERVRNLVTNFGLFGLFHLLYLAIAVAGFRSAYRRTQALAPLRRRIYRTGIAALLFSPGMLIAWPAAMPSFALLALVAFLVSLPMGELNLSLGLLVYSLGPMLVVWGLMFLLAQLIDRVRGTKPGP